MGNSVNDIIRCTRAGKKENYSSHRRGGRGALDSMTYDYNICGWLLGANRAFVKDTLSTANFFDYDLGYDKTAFAINGSLFAGL